MVNFEKFSKEVSGKERHSIIATVRPVHCSKYCYGEMPSFSPFCLLSINEEKILFFSGTKVGPLAYNDVLGNQELSRVDRNIILVFKQS